MIQFKICGITNLDDANVAMDSGASAIGFIFYPKSPRYIEPEKAREITQKLNGNVKTVGVFVDETAEQVNDIAEQVNLDFIQLHGDESPEDCRKIQRPVIKSFRIRDGFNLSTVNNYPVNAVLLDTYVKGTVGGTGEVFHWDDYDYGLVNKPLILAGGLTPENVTKGVQIVKPGAIDISSGVEVSPGKKDMMKIEKLGEILTDVYPGTDEHIF